MTRAAALRRVAGHVAELTFLIAGRAGLGWHDSRMEISALAAFPKSLVALRTDITREFFRRRVTAVGTRIASLLVFHFLYLISFL